MKETHAKTSTCNVMNNDLRHGFSRFSQRFSKSLRPGSNFGCFFSDISRFTLISLHISFYSPRGGHREDLTDNSFNDSQLLEKLGEKNSMRNSTETLYQLREVTFPGCM